MKFNQIKTSFLAGELSPKLDGRTELPTHQAGCAILENFLLGKTGGAFRRPGTQWIPFTTATPGPARAVDYVVSKALSYTLYFRQDGNVDTFKYQSGGITGGTQFSGLTFPYTNSQVYEFQYVQSGSVLYMVHPSVQPKKYGGTPPVSIFSGLSNSDLVDAVPYRDLNTTGITLVASGGAYTTGTTGVTITASSSLFQSTHVGSTWKHVDATGKVGAFLITGYTSATVATVTVLSTLYSPTVATSLWYEGAWSDYRGWPRTVSFFEDRLVYGGNSAEPDSLWGSRVGGYGVLNPATFNKTTGALDTPVSSDAVKRQLNSQQVNEIQWMSAGKTLAVGTFGGEYVIDTLSSSGSAKLESPHGSQYVKPVRSAYTVMFVPRVANTVRDLAFEFMSQNYVSQDLGLMAEHMPGQEKDVPGKIIQIAYQESTSILWCVDDQGGLFACTRDKALGINGWHRHRLGGSYTSGGVTTSPKVNSICFIPSTDTSFDDMYLSVTRTVNGSTAHYYEVMHRPFSLSSLSATGAAATSAIEPMLTQPVFVDCAIGAYSSSAITAWTGAYFPNTTVAMLGDGVYLGTTTTNGSGDITTPIAVKSLIYGHPYTSKLKTTRFDGGGVQTGSAQTAFKRILSVVFRLYRTASATVGRDSTHKRALTIRPVGTATNVPIPLLTGDINEDWNFGTETDGQVYVETSDPLPCNILAITIKGEVNER